MWTRWPLTCEPLYMFPGRLQHYRADGTVCGMENWQRIAAKVNAATAPPPLSKAQLARNIGLTRQALQRRINQGGWKYEELKRLANALNTTVDELERDDHGQ